MYFNHLVFCFIHFVLVFPSSRLTSLFIFLLGVHSFIPFCICYIFPDHLFFILLFKYISRFSVQCVFRSFPCEYFFSFFSFIHFPFLLIHYFSRSVYFCPFFSVCPFVFICFSLILFSNIIRHVFCIFFFVLNIIHIIIYSY